MLELIFDTDNITRSEIRCRMMDMIKKLYTIVNMKINDCYMDFSYDKIINEKKNKNIYVYMKKCDKICLRSICISYDNNWKEKNLITTNILQIFDKYSCNYNLLDVGCECIVLKNNNKVIKIYNKNILTRSSLLLKIEKYNEIIKNINEISNIKLLQIDSYYEYEEVLVIETEYFNKEILDLSLHSVINFVIFCYDNNIIISDCDRQNFIFDGKNIYYIDNAGILKTENKNEEEKNIYIDHAKKFFCKKKLN